MQQCCINRGKGLLPACPLTDVIVNGMYSPCGTSAEYVLEKLTKYVSGTNVGKIVQEGGCEVECVYQVSNDRSLVSEWNKMKSNALGSRKKACRNSFLHV